MAIFLLVMSVIFFGFWTILKKLEKPAKRSLRRVRPSKEERNEQVSNLNLTWDRARKEFLELSVLKRHDKVLICEISKLRGEPEERVFIRINNRKPKSVRSNGQYLVATYPKAPTKEEMRKDFSSVLKRY